MKRSHLKEVGFKGEITAFLAMLFLLMMSLVGALVESSSIQITKNRKRADTILAMESVFGEYNRALLEEYNILARSEEETQDIEVRMSFYGADHMTHRVVRKELLSDAHGQAFFEQGVSYMKDTLGVDTESEGEYKEEFEFDSQTEQEEVFEELESMLAEAGESLPQEGNPLITFQNLQNTDLLLLLMEDMDTLSNRNIPMDGLPSRRTLEKGNYGEVKERTLLDKVLFVEYLTRHFDNVSRSQLDTEKQGLLYEQEYLLVGGASDRENLEKVCKEILNVRMAMNYAYLMTDSVKQAEAEAMALSLCTLLTVPGITEIVKHAILLAWAYGEGIVDVRELLKGEKVPLVKSAETWNLQLLNLAKLGTSEEIVEGNKSGSGWSYQMYIRAFLILKNSEKLSMRGLDLIESNLGVRTDQCITKAEIISDVKLRRGVTDQYKTAYGYQ